MKKRVCVVLWCCMILMTAVSISGCAKDTKESATDTATADATGDTGTETPQAQGLYVIVEVDTEEQSIRFWNLQLERLQTYNYNGSTYILDEYGGNESIGQLEPGDMVSIGLQEGKYVLSIVQEASETWEYEELEEFEINTQEADQSYIQIGNGKYRLSDNLLVFSGGEQVTLEDISAQDILTVRGHDRQVDSIVIQAGHGTLLLQGTENYVGGWYCIGNIMSGPVTENLQLEVTEGTYLFSAANKGYGGSVWITVVRGETLTVNLNELEGTGSSSCELTFHITPEGTQLTIDGQATDYSNPITLQYGTYTLQLTAPGYDTITRTLIVNSAKADITLEADVVEDESEDSTEDTSTDTTEDGSSEEEDEDEDASASIITTLTSAIGDSLTGSGSSSTTSLIDSLTNSGSSSTSSSTSSSSSSSSSSGSSSTSKSKIGTYLN